MDGLRVLDLACGTGEISRMLCSLGAHVTGLDFSEAMLKKAQVKLSDQNWVPLLCDAEDLKGVSDASVDFATTRLPCVDPWRAAIGWSGSIVSA
ncbi:class I SAM-dependent methyltransferase [Candidatus Rhodobacter oscarellae]|uniref:class I SAM-dependent methyltransferase n=1 Tax=Candidatus Rhodobacter oscarellae TaxID=1675527 RepID=UPI0009E2203D